MLSTARNNFSSSWRARNRLASDPRETRPNKKIIIVANSVFFSILTFSKKKNKPSPRAVRVVSNFHFRAPNRIGLDRGRPLVRRRRCRGWPLPSGHHYRYYCCRRRRSRRGRDQFSPPPPPSEREAGKIKAVRACARACARTGCRSALGRRSAPRR